MESLLWSGRINFPGLIPAGATWLSFDHDDGARIVKLLHS